MLPFWFDLFLEARAEILEKNWLVFWMNWRHQKDILKLIDLKFEKSPCLFLNFSIAVMGPPVIFQS